MQFLFLALCRVERRERARQKTVKFKAAAHQESFKVRFVILFFSAQSMGSQIIAFFFLKRDPAEKFT